MFGIGPTELLIIVLLLLVVFGPGKAASMARDFGRFVSGAQNTVEEFKSELVDSEEIKEARRTVVELKDEARHSVEEVKKVK
jgi:Sec-independent protein translocase protein TatA